MSERGRGREGHTQMKKQKERTEKKNNTHTQKKNETKDNERDENGLYAPVFAKLAASLSCEAAQEERHEDFLLRFFPRGR